VPDELTWRQVRDEALARLAAVGAPSPAADARWMVEAAARDVDGPVTERSLAWFDSMLERRLAGEPLQYVLGSWSFRSLDLLVDRRVLIPRPETEVVAQVAIDELRRTGGGTLVDLGTGSGAIGLSIAVEVVTAEVWLTDASPDALDVARANLAGIGRPGQRVRVVEGDWFDALPLGLVGAVDVVVANPPYVATGDELPDEVRNWEPSSALLAGPDGLDDLRRIIREAPAWLARPGVLVLECAPGQTAAVAGLLEDGGFEEVTIVPDLAGRPRCVRGRLS
jgi:release factor glutamine methyltransferase